MIMDGEEPKMRERTAEDWVEIRRYIKNTPQGTFD